MFSPLFLFSKQYLLWRKSRKSAPNQALTFLNTWRECINKFCAISHSLFFFSYYYYFLILNFTLIVYINFSHQRIFCFYLRNDVLSYWGMGGGKINTKRILGIRSCQQEQKIIFNKVFWKLLESIYFLQINEHDIHIEEEEKITTDVFFLTNPLPFLWKQYLWINIWTIYINK